MNPKTCRVVVTEVRDGLVVAVILKSTNIPIISRLCPWRSHVPEDSKPGRDGKPPRAVRSKAATFKSVRYGLDKRFGLEIPKRNSSPRIADAISAVE